jgi:hypothetical protein
MSPNPNNVIVVDGACKTCGGESIHVYHESFPELRVGAPSAGEAAERLAARLENSLATVADRAHRDPALQALADVRAFVDRQGPVHPGRDLKAR